MMSGKLLTKKFLVVVVLATLLSNVCAITEAGLTPNFIPQNALAYRGHHYYVFSGVGNSWEEAHRFCESIGGHLATIKDDAENQRLYRLMKESGYDSAYFGLTRDERGNWRWVTREPITYTNWNPGEPNNERGIERYGMFYWKFQYTWNDGDYGSGTVGDTTAIICEWDY